MLYDLETLHIINAFKIDSNNMMIDTFTFSLLPILPSEYSELYFAIIEVS